MWPLFINAPPSEWEYPHGRDFDSYRRTALSRAFRVSVVDPPGALGSEPGCRLFLNSGCSYVHHGIVASKLCTLSCTTTTAVATVLVVVPTECPQRENISVIRVRDTARAIEDTQNTLLWKVTVRELPR